jgi:phosphate butyryltransferase
MISKLSDFLIVLKTRPPKHLVAVNAVDEHTLDAVNEAVDAGIITATLTGDPEKIGETCAAMGIHPGKFRIVQASDDEEAALKGIEMIAKGEAHILMKGLLSTDKYMRAILNKDFGLLPPKGLLSHVAVMENKEYHKLLIVSDVAIIPYPDLSQKIIQTGYLIKVAQMLGIQKPKVALIAATEQVLPALSSCTDAAVISKMAERGQIPGAIVDGPLAFDVAVDRESAEIKKISSPVAGDADCLLFPNIDSGNVFYKMNTKMCHSEQAAIVMGAKVPVVLSSRGDSMLTKFYSIALAALMD